MNTRKKRALAYIESEMSADFFQSFREGLEKAEKLVQRAESRYAERPTARRRLRVKRARQALDNFVEEQWEEAYQDVGVRIQNGYHQEKWWYAPDAAAEKAWIQALAGEGYSTRRAECWAAAFDAAKVALGDRYEYETAEQVADVVDSRMYMRACAGEYRSY